MAEMALCVTPKARLKRQHSFCLESSSPLTLWKLALQPSCHSERMPKAAYTQEDHTETPIWQEMETLPSQQTCGWASPQMTQAQPWSHSGGTETPCPC